MTQHRIVSGALLRKQDLDRLGTMFTRLWPVGNAPGFEELLEAIDQAGQRLGAQGRE